MLEKRAKNYKDKTQEIFNTIRYHTDGSSNLFSAVIVGACLPNPNRNGDTKMPGHVCLHTRFSFIYVCQPIKIPKAYAHTSLIATELIVKSSREAEIKQGVLI